MAIEELWPAASQAALDDLSAALLREDLCGALLAIEGASAEQAAAIRGELAAFSADVASRVTLDEPATAQARALSKVLSGAGFRGDEGDYHAPENSRLTRVFERRRGLPILLSAVWMLTGRGAGLIVEGVGLPGHFIARVGGPEGAMIDPFAGGTPLSVGECKRLVRRLSGDRLAWRDDFLAATDTVEMAERTLRNLINSHTVRKESVELYRTAKLWCALRPEAPEPHLSAAIFAERLGARLVALEGYADVLARFGDSGEAGVARERLGRLERRGAAN
jgi:regulator of sirC expression with transglutaminase-like and TPR domain